MSGNAGLRACLTGIGQSEIGRRLGRDPLELTLDACLAAIEDAGLTVAEIDGLTTYPGIFAGPAGFSGASAVEVQDALRLELSWLDSGLEGPGQLVNHRSAGGLVAVEFQTSVAQPHAVQAPLDHLQSGHLFRNE